jgi:hypothetical protein
MEQGGTARGVRIALWRYSVQVRSVMQHSEGLRSGGFKVRRFFQKVFEKSREKAGLQVLA